MGLLELLILSLAAPLVMWRRRVRRLAVWLLSLLRSRLMRQHRAGDSEGGFYRRQRGTGSAGLSGDDYRNDLRGVGIRPGTCPTTATGVEGIRRVPSTKYFAIEEVALRPWADGACTRRRSTRVAAGAAERYSELTRPLPLARRWRSSAA